MGIVRVLFAVVMTVLSVAAPARAADEKLPDTFMLRLGGYQVNNLGVIGRVDANAAAVGTYIDFQETLGGESQATVARLDGRYRFSRKHGMGFTWYSMSFDGSRLITQDIIWSGVTYTKDTQVNSKLRFDIYKADYQYSLFHNEEVELGVAVGLHVIKTFASLEATDMNKTKDESVTAPLPVVGINAVYHFTPKLSAYYSSYFFAVNYDNRLEGGYVDHLVGLEYRLFRNVAFGASYNRFSMQVKAKGDDVTFDLDAYWNGGMLYGAMYF